jgi:hypothetical protein
MKIRSLCLLLIFCINLVPINPVQAQEEPARSVYDSIALMYLSDAVLLGETELEEAVHPPGLLAPAANNLYDEPDNAALAAALHSLKAMRNDHDAKCNLLVAHFQGQEKDCEAEKVKSLCAQKKQEINAEIGKLHDKRGDRRRGPTKIWHWLKRSGQGIWYRIGPVGRRFLRQVGPEALKIVASGGSLSLDVAKNLLKHTAKSMIRDRIRPAMLHGIERLLKGQIEIAQAAGVDICDPEEDQTQNESEQPKDEKKTGEDFELPDSGVWDLSCQDKDEFRDKYYQTVVWNVTIDWKARTFEGMIEAQGDQIFTTKGAYGAPDIVEITHLDWKEIGSGSVTEDGFFWGDFSQAVTTTNKHQGVVTNINTRESTENWIGAISENLDQVCFYRVGAQDWFTLDWIRERGRNELVGPENRFCEASCQVY